MLWFEHDLYDQLQLLDVLALAHTEEAAPELIVIGSFPGKPSFAGLGELTAGELETLWPSRRPAEPAALEAAASAWAAFQAPEPTALAEWATRETTQLPFLGARAAAAARGTARAGDGLSGTERRALAGDRRRRPHTSGRLRRRATTRGRALPRRRLVLPEPSRHSGRDTTRLLETDDGDAASAASPAQRRPALRTPPAATDGNRRTHARGEADRVELLGIDRWIGGTHVTPDNTWRWDPTELKLVPPSRH